MRTAKSGATLKSTVAGVLRVGSSPLPLWVSFLMIVFVTVSAVDDVRLFIVTGQDGSFPWWPFASTVTYWAVWMSLAFRPQLTAIVFAVMLAAMYPSTQPAGALLLAFGALAVAAYRVSTRSLAAVVACFLVWQIVWVLGVSELNRAVLWGYVLVTLLLATPGLALKLLREKAIRAERDQRAAEETAAAAALEQRTELARELHDVVTHGLTMIAVQANLGTISTDGTEQHRALTEIGAMSRSSLDELRRLLQTMRTDEIPAMGLHGAEPSVSPNPACIDLAQSVADSQKRLNALGVPTRVTTSGDLDRTPNGLRSTVLRVLQESATNAVKHAGGGGECTISMNVREDDIELTIRNLMTPGEPRLPTSGTGLAGLRERASRLGGTLDAGPVDGWWNVRIVLPFVGRQTLR